MSKKDDFLPWIIPLRVKLTPKGDYTKTELWI